MAIIPLRAYNREIENMVDTGRVDEAIAHCRHILQSFPKHVATYRLLGKAHLENQRFGDASDVFQRVLSVVPDDFVANVGMSIVREDEGNLDSAIWHMERAFETQPANSAIQEELRRLYGRRDGIEPPKVRLTRGALARMYARSNLYDQCIAELRAALADDPQRPDLQVLLAQMHYQAGQRVEAVDTCSGLIKKYPYCLEANRVLAAILPETERAEDTKIYQQRVFAMDPYAAKAEPKAMGSEHISDEAVNIERLAWKPGQSVDGAAQPAWATSLGAAFEDSSQATLPEWLSGESDAPALVSGAQVFPSGVASLAPEESQPAMEEPAPSRTEGEAIPDWMEEAGWKPSTGEAQEGPVSFDESELPAPAEDGPLAPAEIPDWLKGMAPEGALDQELPPLPADDGEAVLPWLAESEPGPSDTVVSWLDQAQPKSAEPAAPPDAEQPSAALGAEEVPDWIKDLGPAGAELAEAVAEPLAAEETAAPAEEMPDWLSATETPEAKYRDDLEGAAVTPPAAEETAGEEEIPPIPDWLSDTATPEAKYRDDLEGAVEAPAAESEVPDWLRGEEEEPGDERTGITDWLKQIQAEEGLPSSADGPAEAADEIPAWIKEDAAETPVAGQPIIEEPAAPAEDVPDWLSELAAETPAVEQPVTEEPAALAEEVPDWLAGMAAETPAVEQPVTEEPSALAEEVPDWLAGMAAETPAVEQPVTEEAAALAEEVPDWLSEVATETPAVEQPITEEPAAPAEELPDWLAGMAAETPAVEQPVIEEPAAPAEELPDWLSEMAVETPAAETPVEEPPTLIAAAPPAAAPDLSDEDAALAWMESLAAKHGAAEEELITKPADRLESAPDWVKEESEQVVEAAEEAAAPAEELPDWLGEMAADTPAAEQPIAEEPAAPAEEVPDWLAGMAAETPAVEQPIAEEPAAPAEELPDWLAGMAAETPAVEQPVTEEAAALAEEVPDWLSEMATETPAVEQPMIEEPAAPAEELPDWLAGMAAETPAAEQPVTEEPAALAEEVPDWLAGMAAETPAVEQPIAEEPAAPAEELPDWLSEMAAEAPAVETPIEEPPTLIAAAPLAAAPDLSDEDAALAWMESLAAKHGAAEEELITKPADRLESAPDWVKEESEQVVEAAEEAAAPAEEVPDWLAGMAAETPAVEQPIAEEPAALAEELPDWLAEMTAETPAAETPIEEPPTLIAAAAPDLSDEDAALAWMESLAAKHGAAEEELITKPGDRLESAPDWVKEESEQVVEAAEEGAAPAEELPDWLGEMTAETPAAETPVEEPPTLIAAAPPAAAPDLSDEDAALAWMESLAAKHGAAEEELITKPADRLESAPDWVKEESEQVVEAAEEAAAPAEELPDWLGEMAAEAPAVEQPVTEEPAAPAEELPDWLAGMAAEPPTVEQPVTEEPAAISEELPDWLAEMTAETPAAETPVEEPPTLIAAAAPDLSDEDAALAWMESLAAKHGAAEEELITKPGDRLESAPDWVKEESEQVVEAAEEAAAPAEELPDWLGEMTAETPAVEQPIAEEPAALAEELPDWLSEMAAETPAAETPVEEPPTLIAAAPLAAAPDLSDEDAALAWMEGLAAKHGAAEEELLTKPADRLESAPDWVKEESEQVVEESAALSEELPAWLAETAAAAPEAETILPEDILEQIEEELLGEEETEETIHPEAASDVAEPEIALAPAAQPEPEVEIPTEEMKITEVLPPAEAMQVEEIAIEEPEKPSLNINTASLAQLEALPGIGYVLAQSILAYREEHGAFANVDDLEKIDGIGAGIVNEVRGLVNAAPPTQKPLTKTGPLPRTGPLPADKAEAELVLAQQALEDGNAGDAVEHYRQLVRKGQHLDQVVNDLQASLYRFPVDIQIWQTLGDAYLRSDRLQDALDAYVKAEELLR